MATVRRHYEDVLAGFYSWLYGGHAAAIATNMEFFKRHGISPAGSALAVDLGAGSGFQSIPLALSGFKVTAIDYCHQLLRELSANDTTSSVITIRDDLTDFTRHVTGPVEIITCMTDTLLHLDSAAQVRDLANRVFNALEENGRFIVTFRDLTRELTGVDRILPVRSDANTIFTCFLEYQAELVNVHDVIYHNNGNGWQLFKSSYPKLRLSGEWVERCLSGAGLSIMKSDNSNGLITIIAQKKAAGN